MTPACSVIVPAYNSAATIENCLASLLQQDAAPVEIVVVDSGVDATAAIVREHARPVRLIHLDQPLGPAEARNLGVKEAAGRIVAFLDSDCVAPRHWLARLSQAIDRGYAGAGGAIANGNGETAVSWAGYLCEFREFLPGGPAREVDNLTLGNAAYRREIFLELGGLPERMFPQEDQVFHARWKAAGHSLWYDPTIVVQHWHRTQGTAFLAHQQEIGRANARTLRRLGRRGAWLTRSSTVARALMPALVPYRWVRTLLAGRRLTGLDRRAVATWCWRGTWAWGAGLVSGIRELEKGQQAS